MQNEIHIVRDVSARLERVGIEYMLTGSMAMNYYAHLSKLFWARDSRSELQMQDVKNLIMSGCDRSYINRWTHELGVDILWEELSDD